MAGNGGKKTKAPSRLKTKMMNGEAMPKDDQVAMAETKSKPKQARRKVTAKPVKKKNTAAKKSTKRKTAKV